MQTEIFETLKAAEEFLTQQGFKLVPDTGARGPRISQHLQAEAFRLDP